MRRDIGTNCAATKAQNDGSLRCSCVILGSTMMTKSRWMYSRNFMRAGIRMGFSCANCSAMGTLLVDVENGGAVLRLHHRTTLQRYRVELRTPPVEPSMVPDVLDAELTTPRPTLIEEPV